MFIKIVILDIIKNSSESNLIDSPIGGTLR